MHSLKARGSKSACVLISTLQYRVLDSRCQKPVMGHQAIKLDSLN